MKTKIYSLIITIIFVFGKTYSQDTKTLLTNKKASVKKDSAFFNYSYWNGVADKWHLNAAEREELISGQKKNFMEEQIHEDHEHFNFDELVWAKAPSNKKYSQNSTNAGPCTNIDFENGDFSGWTRSTGWNPIINSGCCPDPNGDQAIMTGAGLDPFGGFPVVYPGGGSFSLRLGSTAIGGRADRIEQTFFVTPANANFTYRYAVVLNDPGHTMVQQPFFASEIIDSLGNQISCTVYSVTAAGNIPGFITSPNTGPSNSAVRYKTWTDVAVDLTPNIGQNVTIRFTVADCSLTGHFAYAYVDGFCTDFRTSVSDTTCPNVPIPICAPAGFSTTTWNGPGVINDPNQCLLVSAPGVYSCTTLLGPGCPGPTFTHTLVNLPSSNLSFTAHTTGPCATQYTFVNGSTLATPYNFLTYQWFFGDGSVSTSSTNVMHNYTSPGTYAVKLKTFNDAGCYDSLVNYITIFPLPNLSFSPPSNCVNTVTQFSNTSTINVGSITSYTWNFHGMAPNTNLLNPSHTYVSDGTYSITLSATSNQGCLSTLVQTLGIFPPPIISFSAATLCDAVGTSFAPSTSTAITSGSLASFFWNFGDGGTSTDPLPVHVYTTSGVYTVSFTAISNHNCSASTSNTFAIYPSPNLAFSTTSLNACSPNFTFTNNSNIASGSVTYTWSFGGSNTTTATNPSIVFPTIGDYTVSLIGLSDLGCRDTLRQYISVYPYPIIDFNVPASCESAIFTVSTTAVSGSVTSYVWNFGDPASGANNTSTLQNPTHFYGSTGTYTINLNIMSNLNCPSSTVVPITVFPNPVASLTYSTLNNCSLPYSFLHTATVSGIGASTITDYLWSFESVGTSSLASPGIVNFPSNGNYSVSLIVTTNHNCSDTVSVPVLVHPLPELNFTVNPTCINVPVTIIPTHSISLVPSPGASVTSFAWDYGDNTFTNTAIPSAHTYTAAQVYTVSFSATSNMGCSATVTKSVEIYPTASVGFTTTSNMCMGNVTQFTGTTSIGSGTVFALNWDFGDGTQGTNQIATHTYSLPGNYPVTFSATTNHECITSETRTVTIHPVPVNSYTANDVCLDLPTNFASTSSISTGFISSYSWDLGDGTLSSFANPLPHTYTLHGTYTPSFTATSNHGCSSTFINTVVIHPLPQISFNPPSACINSLIQFTNTSGVAVGSITSYVWDFSDGSPTSTLVNPSHTYTTDATYIVTVTATTDRSCVRTATNAIAIYPFPSGSIFPINNSCVNNQVNINPNISITGANNPVPSYTVSFGDGSPAIVQNTSLPPLIPHTYSVAGSYTVSIMANSTNNCARTFTNSVTVYPRPFASFSANSFCYRDSTKFVNTSTIAPQYSITGYYWDFAEGLPTSNSTLTSPSYSFSAPGAYHVTLTVFSQPEANLSCNQTVTNTITINPLPIPLSFSSNSVCLGSPTQFSNSTPTTGITGWSWFHSTPGLVTGVGRNSSFTYTNAGQHTATLIALNSFGCRRDTTGTVRVYQNPVSSYTTNNNCLGVPSIFFNNTQYPDGTSAAHLWTTGITTITTNMDATHQFSAPGTYSVSLTSTSNFGCVNVFTSTITVYPLPALNFNASEACFGTPTQFNNFSTGAISSYTWNFGDSPSGPSNISNSANPTHLYSGSGNYNVQLQVTSDRNCNASASGTAVVHSIPSANFTHSTICVGDRITFDNLSTSTNGSITSNYWDFNGDNIIDQNAVSPLHTYTTTGNFQVKLIISTQYGCSADTTIGVFVNPKAVGSIASNGRSGCPPLCVNFQNLSTISTGTYTTSWDFGDGNPVNTFESPSHCFESGSYDITLTMVSDIGCVTRFFQPGYVTVHPLPTARFKVEPEQIDENEPVITVTNQSSSDVNFIRYYVTDGSNFGTPNFTHYIKNLGQTKPMVVQTVKNEFGCADTISQVLEIKPAYVIYFPDVFTPNGDRINDAFVPKGVGISAFTMQIYDRWGHVVFTTNDIADTWDGTIKSGSEQIKEDIYTWRATVTDIFNKKHFLVGHVTLIR